MPEDRRLAAIMFTDIVGYTALMGSDEDKAFRVLRKNRQIQRPIIKKYRGEWLKEMGDGILASFHTASDAVRCAGDIQQAVIKEGIALRIGIHEGEVVFEGGDVLGDGVNVASRLEGMADEGCINISGAVYKDIKNKSGITAEFIGEKELKNVEEPVKVYKVRCEEYVKDDLQNVLPEKSKKKLLYYILGSILIMIISLALIWHLYLKKQSDVETRTIERSIAVLAFNDQSPNGDQEWLGDGVADEILNVLTKVEGLKVIGKTSSFSFKGKDATIKEIGEKLNVKTVLEGSVSKIGNQLRITAQLIDVDSEAHIWSDKYDREAADILDIIDEVAKNISGSLISELSIEEAANIKMVYQPQAEAYEYLIKAQYIAKEYNARHENEDGFFSAREMYLKAISIDPDYVDAIVRLSDLYDSRAWMFNTRANRVIRDSLLNVAYQMDPNAPSVLYSKGFATNNIDSAFYFIKKGYDQDPYYGNGVLLVNKLLILGLYDICLPLCYKYLARDLLNPSLQDFLVSCLWNTGRIDEAREQLMKGLELHEDLFWLNMLLFYMKVFVDQDIIEAKKISEKLDPSYDSRSIESKALLLAMEGKKEEALKIDSGWRVKIKLGMKSEALSSLDQIINGPDYPSKDYYYGYLSLKGHIFFESIRDEPQFQKWLKEAKLKYDERMRKYGHLFDD
jgi:TolB-like protein